MANLTTAQLQTLKAAINADPALAAMPNNNDSASEIAAAFNVTASPAFVVWRSSVSQDEIMQNGFDWTRVDNLSVGKARVWEWMFNNQQRAINPSKANVRAGIDQTWVGTAADLAVRAAVYAHCKRNATRGEKLFATGTGTDADPATMAVEGAISQQNVVDARSL